MRHVIIALVAAVAILGASSVPAEAGCCKFIKRAFKNFGRIVDDVTKPVVEVVEEATKPVEEVVEEVAKPVMEGMEEGGQACRRGHGRGRRDPW